MNDQERMNYWWKRAKAAERKLDEARRWAKESYDPFAHEGADSSQLLELIGDEDDAQGLRERFDSR